MKNLYKCAANDVLENMTNYRVRVEKPTIIKAYKSQKLSAKILLNNIYWYIITRGKYRVWCVYDEAKIIHTSYVVPKCGKFSFLDKDDFEIGPCYTDTVYRGKGIYPAILFSISLNVAKNDGNIYMIVDSDNKSTIRGIEKAGFKILPGVVKVNSLKKWIYYPNE